MSLLFFPPELLPNHSTAKVLGIVPITEETAIDRGRERGQLGAWDEHTLLYIRQITNKDLLSSTGNSIQYSVVAFMRKESQKGGIYLYV